MFVALDSARLYFDVLSPALRLTPDGVAEKPVLVALHGGMGGDHVALRPEIDRLAEHAQLVLFDQRGCGRSDAGAPESWTLDQWADDTAAFCGALGIARPILFGYSAGGYIALRAAARHPDLASALILAAPTTRYVREERIAEFERRGGPEAAAAARAMFERCAPEDYGPYLARCLPLYYRRPPADAAARAGRSRFSIGVNRHFFAPGGEAWRMDLAADAAAVSCPTLVISGADDPIAPPEMGRELAAAIQGGQGRFVVFEGSSHALLTDEPERLAAAVADFIATL